MTTLAQAIELLENRLAPLAAAEVQSHSPLLVSAAGELLQAVKSGTSTCMPQGTTGVTLRSDTAIPLLGTVHVPHHSELSSPAMHLVSVLHQSALLYLSSETPPAWTENGAVPPRAARAALRDAITCAAAAVGGLTCKTTFLQTLDMAFGGGHSLATPT